jgi:Phosphotransferase enzyme family
VTASRVLSRTLPVLHSTAARWRHRSELRWVAEAAPRLVSRVQPITGGGWRTEAVRWTSTSVAVAVVAHHDSARRLVVKIPSTAGGAASLRRQLRVLSALAGDPRLREWQAVLPKPLHEGDVNGRHFCIEEALPGEPGARLVRRGRASAVLDSSASLIDELHSRTATERRLDEAAVEAWVELPLRRLERLAHSRLWCGELRERVDRLRRELPDSLLDRTVRLSWIHGDYWAGNVLASPQTGRITGVVDWDQGGPDQLRLHDLLHLYLYARCLRRGEELGDVVVEALKAGVPEAIGVAAGRVESWMDELPARASLLLYWLRHVTLFLDTDGHHDNRYWIRNNIDKVLLHA